MTLLNTTLIEELKFTSRSLATAGKGLLAADESVSTLSKRFKALQIPCTEESRKNYRELLLTTQGLEHYIAGVILHEETLLQTTQQGITFPNLLQTRGIIPGIKVDQGLIALNDTTEEKTTRGLDGLAERLIHYKKQGARFSKWRAVYSITSDTPSTLAIQTNAEQLACYAAIAQAAGMVPIIEPEILIDGNHSLETCFEVTQKVLVAVFQSLYLHQVLLEYIVLKPSMVIPGKDSIKPINTHAIAKATVTVLRNTVPPAVPSINFLSGGQTPEQATENLNAINQFHAPHPWNLSFSFARALQEPCMQAWRGNPNNILIAQQLLSKQANLNSLASLGRYHLSPVT
jgi:fructose-bisphosphate aldolase class I